MSTGRISSQGALLERAAPGHRRLPPPATAVDRLAARSRETPERVALRSASRTLNYRETFEIVCNIARILRKAGVVGGRRVAVGVKDPLWHLLVLLACEGLAAVSASFDPGEGDEAEALLAICDHIVSESPRVGHSAPILVDEVSWFRRAPQSADGVRLLRHESHELVRIVRTAGVMRQAGLLPLSRRVLRERTRMCAAACQLGADAVEWLVCPFTVDIVYHRALAVLAMGGTIVVAPQSVALNDLGANRLLTVPGKVDELLDAARGTVTNRPLHVTVVGGELSASAKDQLLGSIARSVQCLYGTDEVGIACEMMRDRRGWILGEAEVGVVDELGRALPVGAQGFIAIRSPGMAGGYLRDDAMTEKHFRDGWFFTGHRGQISGRWLQLLGRVDG